MAMELVNKLAGPLLAAFGVGRLIMADTDGGKLWWTIAILAGVLFTGLAAFRTWWLDFRSARAIGSGDALHGMLHTLHSSLKDVAGDGGDCRVCLYAPRPEEVEKGRPPKELHQITPYISDREPEFGEKVRGSIRTSIGVVGFAYRKNERAFVQLDDPAQSLVDYLINFHAFDEEEAKGVRADRRSWAAVPIGDSEGPPVGIIFADSSDPNFFGPSGAKAGKVTNTIMIHGVES